MNSSTAPFTAKTRIRFWHGDPAGIAFFASAYQIAHDAYEDFVAHLGLERKSYFENAEWAAPIRQSSCDHLSPLRPGDECETAVTIEKIGDSSVTILYSLNVIGEKGARPSAQVRLVHVFIDVKKMAKTPIPSNVRERFETYQRQSLGS